MLLFVALLIVLAASGTYFSLERSSRRVWSRVPVKKVVKKTPYRGEGAPVVAGYYGKAPRAVRIAAFGIFALAFVLPIEWVIDRWRVGAYPERRPFKSSLAAAWALMMRREDALERAKQVGDLHVLVAITLFSIWFSFSPFLLDAPWFLGVCAAITMLVGAHAWLLLRIAKGQAAAFAPEIEEARDGAPKTKSHEEEENVPPWLLRALARRAETRPPHVRIEAPAKAGVRVLVEDDAKVDVAPEIEDAPERMEVEAEPLRQKAR